ncbi:MAG TPA: hypothetical protein VIR82_19940, partial [Bradyrhizobium sp.]
ARGEGRQPFRCPVLLQSARQFVATSRSTVRQSRAQTPVETTVSDSETTGIMVRESSARRYTGDTSPW